MLPEFLRDKRVWQYVAVIVLAVIFIFSERAALRTGQRRAQATLLAQNAAAIMDGLRLFKADQDRYPAATEYADRNVMLSYFNQFPPLEFPSAKCEQSLLYRRPKPETYELYVCSPANFAGLPEGWGKVSP